VLVLVVVDLSLWWWGAGDVHPRGAHEATADEAGAVNVAEDESHQLRHEFVHVLSSCRLCVVGGVFSLLFLPSELKYVIISIFSILFFWRAEPVLQPTFSLTQKKNLNCALCNNHLQ
jgi:hypothetical protein